MKFLTALILCLSLNAFADHHEEKDEKKWEEQEKKWEGMSFEDAKKMKLERLDKNMKMMEEHRQCINDAKDKEGLKACMKTMKDKHHEMKKEMKEKRKEMKGKKNK